MPDGDKIHGALSRQYYKPYKQLCGGQFNDEERAREVLRVLNKDIITQGDGPRLLLERIAAELSSLPQEPILRAMVDWGKQSVVIEMLAQQANGPKRAIALAVQAGKEVIHSLRYGESIQELPTELAARYITKMYEANFEQRVPLREQHFNDVDQSTVDARLTSMRPHIEQEIAKLAPQVLRSKHRRLRLSRRKGNKPSITLDADLSLIGT